MGNTINLNGFQDVSDYMTEEEFSKAVIDNKWAVFTGDAIAQFMHDVQKYAKENIARYINGETIEKPKSLSYTVDKDDRVITRSGKMLRKNTTELSGMELSPEDHDDAVMYHTDRIGKLKEAIKLLGGHHDELESEIRLNEKHRRMHERTAVMKRRDKDMSIEDHEKRAIFHEAKEAEALSKMNQEKQTNDAVMKLWSHHQEEAYHHCDEMIRKRESKK